jgi:hypothetical protein
MRPTFRFPQIVGSFAHLTFEVPGVYRHCCAAQVWIIGEGWNPIARTALSENT